MMKLPSFWTLLALCQLSACATNAIPGPAKAIPPAASPLIALPPQQQPVLGIDISRYQGAFDFSKIKGSAHQYVFIKASEGKSKSDADYLRNVGDARAAGLAVGSYHYYRSDDDARSQFTNFFRIASVLKGDLPPVVDIEVLNHATMPDLTAELQRFLDTLENHYGVKPIIYSGRSFASARCPSSVVIRCGLPNMA